MLTLTKAPEDTKTNAELIDALVASAGLSGQDAVRIRGQIVWGDSKDENNNGGVLTLGTGLVSGGRLGRCYNHMLSDVPNHYVQDRLLNYINTVIEADQRDNAAKAVFPNLSLGDIDEYWCILQLQEEYEEEMQMGRERNPFGFLWQESTWAIRGVLGSRSVKSDAERERVKEQAKYLEEVDGTIDLTPKPGFSRRNYDSLRPIRYSIIRPGYKGKFPEEEYLNIGTDIDQDCDQIRAMIRHLILGSAEDNYTWTLDEFRWALGPITRQQLSEFLAKKGPKQGLKTKVYPLAWEFFKKRELLRSIDEVIDMALERKKVYEDGVLRLRRKIGSMTDLFDLLEDMIQEVGEEDEEEDDEEEEEEEEREKEKGRKRSAAAAGEEAQAGRKRTKRA